MSLTLRKHTPYMVADNYNISRIILRLYSLTQQLTFSKYVLLSAMRGNIQYRIHHVHTNVYSSQHYTNK